MNDIFKLFAYCCALLLAACKTDSPGSLAVSDVYAYAPLTGNGPGVAYFTLTNHGEQAVTVGGFESTCFAEAELHRSVLEDGVNRMVAVDPLNITAGASVRLSPAGMHLMLSAPRADVAPGQRCAVRISYGHGQSLDFEIELLDRAQFRPAEPVK